MLVSSICSRPKDQRVMSYVIAVQV